MLENCKRKGKRKKVATEAENVNVHFFIPCLEWKSTQQIQPVFAVVPFSLQRYVSQYSSPICVEFPLHWNEVGLCKNSVINYINSLSNHVSYVILPLCTMRWITFWWKTNCSGTEIAMHTTNIGQNGKQRLFTSLIRNAGKHVAKWSSCSWEAGIGHSMCLG